MQTFNKNDFKKLKDQKANKFLNRVTNEQMSSFVIPEEKYS